MVNTRRAARAEKVVQEPVKGGWDILPHGLGKQEGAKVDPVTPELLKTIPVNKKPGKRGKIAKATQDRSKDKTKAKIVKVGQGNVDEEKSTSTIKPEQDGSDEVRDDNEIKLEQDISDEKSKELNNPAQKKKRAPRTKKLDESADVIEKVEELIDTAENQPKKKKKVKKHPYGLTPGESPYPDLLAPTPEQCEEVNRLLSELHGEVMPPKEIPPPSMEVTGCGEVPDLLDAILRTRLSASTTAHNSNMALKGLKDKFGLRTSGVGIGSVNWEAVNKADLESVIDSIKAGGLAKVKGTDIKKILTMVYEQNCERRDALLKERETGEPANILAADHETKQAKDAELARYKENMLSMDHVFEMTTDEAMDEMTKLPGIGVKTASCVILFCMKRPSFAVDTHVLRHCKWLGWVPANATPDKCFSHCEVRVPAHLKYSLHQLFLRHGKTCGRCRGSTSPGSKEWDKTVCPIEHLVTRTGKRKGPKVMNTSETDDDAIEDGDEDDGVKKGEEADATKTAKAGAGTKRKRNNPGGIGNKRKNKRVEKGKDDDEETEESDTELSESGSEYGG